MGKAKTFKKLNRKYCSTIKSKKTKKKWKKITRNKWDKKETYQSLLLVLELSLAAF